MELKLTASLKRYAQYEGQKNVPTGRVEVRARVERERDEHYDAEGNIVISPDPETLTI